MKYQIIPVTLLKQNCSLVWCQRSKSAALIDPGGNAPILIREIADRGVKLEKIVLTHGHADHVGAAAQVADHFDVPILGPHIADRFLLEALPIQCQLFGLDRVPALQSTRYLSNGEEIQVGDHTLVVHHCPGHTPGHLIFFCRKANLVWVGDLLFHGSVGRTDLPGGDQQALVDSIQRRLLPLGDDVTFIPGHGPQSTLGYERGHNPFICRRT